MATVLALLATLLALLIASCSAAETGARKENVKYLRCEVCEEISKQLLLQVFRKRESVSPKKLTEFDIIELAENLCDLKKEESEWMFYLDIVRQGSKAKLVTHEEEGECGTKCKTIARTCQEVLGDYDTDVAEFIFKRLDGLSQSAISAALCKDWSRACSKPEPVPKNIDFGEAFAPKSSKDADIARIMRSMSGMPGAPGMKMYSKDDLANMKNFGRDAEDDGGDGEEDDEDDEHEVPASSTSLTKSESGFANRFMRLLIKARQTMSQVSRVYARRFQSLKQRVKGRWQQLNERAEL